MGNQSTDRIDVCLLLEGTYPHVRGGVSTWVHQVITALPELSFGILYIGADRKSSGECKYELPSNVRSLERCFLFEASEADNRLRCAKSPANLDARAEEMCGAFLKCIDDRSIVHETSLEDLGQLLDLVFALARDFDFDSVWRSHHVWDSLRSFYRKLYPEEAFVDFFWNARFLVEPLWKIFQASHLIPEARIYHSVSTGYAGILGAMMSRSGGHPFLLSEHGIYVRERIADLLRTEWSSSHRPHSRMMKEGVGVLRHLWIELFVQLGRLTYDSANRIVSLFQLNADYQVEFGADPERIQIIPNGVRLGRFDSVIQTRQRLRIEQPARQNVGFLGRVVSIKDVRTLIRAARGTCSALPEAHFLIVGPTEEDEDYAEGCRELISELQLTDRVILTGPRNVAEALPEFDVMVLSSVSEGLPFAVLEAFAAEMPVVSTEVGSCPEMILGGRRENPSFGPAGFIVPVGDSAALGDALTTLLRDRTQQDRMGKAGRARTEALYQEEVVMESYRKLYEELPVAVPLSSV